MNNLIAWDVGKKSGYYALIEGKYYYDQGNFYDILENYTRIIRDINGTTNLVFYDDMYGYLKIIKSLSFKKGVVYERTRMNIRGELKSFYHNETKVSKEVLNEALKREFKKKKSVEFFVKEHGKGFEVEKNTKKNSVEYRIKQVARSTIVKFFSDDLAEAYVLFVYAKKDLKI